MADNTILNAGTGGDTIASDDIGGVKFQRVKLVHGADGVNDGDVAFGNPLPTEDPATTGTWGYLAGSSGTVSVPAGAKVLQISATSTLGGTFTVNGGAAITIPANQQFTLEPRGQLVAPTVVFTSTSSYVIEFVS